MMAIPFNVIIYYALLQSEYQFPRYIPTILGLAAIILAFSRNKLDLRTKLWSFIALQFLTASFSLLLGLIDVASLWFILAIIYSLLIADKKESLVVFLTSFVLVLIVGILMITKISFIPLKYQFDVCQFACVAIRILHFLLIGSLVYYILNVFSTTIKQNVKELRVKSDDLEKVNLALHNEMIEKKNIQQKMIEAVIQTEEKERKRLASDLHDGLGPVLSAISLYFQAYVDAPDLSNKDGIGKKLSTIINDAIKDVSRISHNISPHILEKYGLIVALENFSEQIQVSEKIEFNLQLCFMPRLHINTELIIYRAITELINNTLKHAEATKIGLALNYAKEENVISINYSDNGKGFDIEKTLQNQSGMGMSNISNRVASLNGEIRYESREGEGMSVTISIPIK